MISSDFLTLKNWLSKIAEEQVLAVKTKNQLLLVADEIFSNIINYSGVKSVDMQFEISESQISLIFSDNGISFNPLEIAEPDITIPLAERKPGGLGVFMVKKLMSSVEYKRDNGKNILTIKTKTPKI